MPPTKEILDARHRIVHARTSLDFLRAPIGADLLLKGSELCRPYLYTLRGTEAGIV